MAYSLKFVLDTFLKQSTALSNQLPPEQLQYIDAGTELAIIALQPIGSDHIQVTFGTDAQGNQIFFKGRNTWYIYRPSVQILRDGQPVTFPAPPAPTPPTPTPPTPTPPTPTPPAKSVYVLKSTSDTWLKQSKAIGASLPDSQRQLLNARTVLPISSYDVVEDNHLKIALGQDSLGNQIFFKGLTTWYVYRSDVQILRDGKVIVAESEPALPNPILPNPGRRQINREGLQLLKSFEGYSATAYQDIVGVWTIGYGTTSGVRPGMRVTQDQAEELLKRDLLRFETAVTNLVKVPLTEDQFSALVSFTYNVGEGALAGSTLLRLLNQGKYQAATNEFLRWNRAGGREVTGLTRRRKAEQALFMGRG